jgi:lysophospholipase L1-like esterase
MRLHLHALGLFMVVSQVFAAGTSPSLKIAIVGDSTVCDYPDTSPLRGWGQLLPDFLQPGVTVINKARGGASTKTFPASSWQTVLGQHPDFVLIQFGHNDSHAREKPESTDAATDYRDNLRRYLNEARAAGATPILVTPVRRRLFSKDGRPTTELAPYADAMKAVGAETRVRVLDLYSLSGDLYESLGEAESSDFTPNQPDHADRPGQGDRTHFTPEGARQIARLVAEALRDIDPKLKACVRLEGNTRTHTPSP